MYIALSKVKLSVWVGSTWISYDDKRKFSALLDWFLLSGIVLVASVHCSNHDSSLFSVAVAAADLHSCHSQYASRAPHVPTHPPICLSSLSHMKKVCVPSHNRYKAQLVTASWMLLRKEHRINIIAWFLVICIGLYNDTLFSSFSCKSCVLNISWQGDEVRVSYKVSL